MRLQCFPLAKGGGGWGDVAEGCRGVGGAVGFWEEVIAAVAEQQRGERQFKIRIAATEMHSGPL